ncbi:SIS domain-containing protein [Bacillus sp. IITD106]|nr:SIS domain-containing protein [Bacillus sp. IITD106]
MNQQEIYERNERLRMHILTLADKQSWQRTLTMTDESIKEFENESWLSEIDTVYIVGHGTSFATALNAESWFAHIAKLNARALPAFQFSRYAEDFLIKPEKTLVIGISCSGNTESVVQSLDIANKSGAITMCLSGKDDMASAKVAKYRIITDAHADRAANLSAYSISHIYLALGAYRLAMIIGSRNGSLINTQVGYWQKQLDHLISSMKSLPTLFERMGEISEVLTKAQVPAFVVLGSGPNFGTAKEGALKISEFSWVFGAAEELEDFAHGRFREVDSKVPLFIISPKGKVCEKTMDLLAGCSIARTPTIILTDEVTPAMEKLGTHIVTMPKIHDEYLTPFLYIFPLWFYGFHIRHAEGGIVGEARHNLFAVDINFKAHYDESGEKLI